ncbi:ribosomal-protein-alanine acetyltransferase [Enterovibrio norvegicus FF-33]|uniref:Ribosomal-protein-alanine acetyltransferase n=1 Tax=Enterovibrio norvegicus FF-454 TaxID=1185651 RepID=A0A1E5C2E8_9GAMM|nr:ribosomal protein S5-alanine N-acetyltransferase [Enterovibrio norvegicus]OEE59669.1 ribosomal-protein-alanine acetyltransferase [Enterovibrio norvegicus FF-454]OEE70238.1 ribosomal-protein-alanine acetyltransferase [Enterovibrio norvegicus FF-33]OEE85600.1 ribosomal-protein-alanine acetyltransferase [Enterovibrio norvegicus FF-162]
MSVEIINPFPSLSVDNLVIRAIQKADVARVVRYFQVNRTFLSPWEPLRPDGFFTYEGWERRVVQLAELQRHGLAYYFLIFEKGSDDVAGVITYNNIMQFPFHACNVGYSLAESSQGKGLMRRSLKITNQWLFDNLNLHRIMASYMPRNTRSEAVLLEAGFTKEGEAKDYLLINGQWEDHILTSVINPDWVASINE